MPSHKSKAASIQPIPSLPPGVRMSTLSNGLTLIIREDHNAPVVSAQAWCKTGSIHEDRWLGAGLSHVLEHMLFKGTATRGPGEIDRAVQAAGGSMNAYTSFDRTVYYIDVPNTGATLAIDILCDIMQNASLPEDELAKEMDVIRREMDMNQDDPSQRAGRRLFETAYTQSPYRFTVIGYPDIFGELKRADIVNYYRERYAPNNLFLVVVGDIKAAEVEEQIRAAFALTKARPMPSLVLPAEPKQLAPREVIEEAAIELGHLHFSWHIPDMRDPDVPILDVLATLLGSGRSSRLYQEVREKKGLVHHADAWTYNPGNPGLFGMSAVVDGDKFDAARAALLHEVERMKQKPVSAAELSKAVKQFTSGTLSARKTMSGQAQDLCGSWMVASDLNFSARYLEVVKRINPADLQRVAREYLTTENQTLYALLPEGARAKLAPTVESNITHPIQKFELPNGLRLLIKEDHRLPFVEFRAVLRGGVLAETPSTNGATVLTSRMLLKGTKSRSAEEISSEIESVGGSMDSYSGNNSLGVNAEVMSNDFSLGLDLLSDVLLRPTFPKAAFEREREVQLAGIKNQRDQLLQSCARLMRETLFSGVGYGLDCNGSEESVGKLTVADIKQAHSRLVAPSNCVLAIFGDVKTDAVRKAVQKAFGPWKNKAQIPELTISPTINEIKRATDTRDKKQAVIVIGFPGSTIFGEDRYALELIQESCSDLGSRLFTRIREKLGLAYYVGAQNFLGLTPGYFGFYAGTEPDKAAVCEKEMLVEAEELRRNGLTPEELSRSKAKVIGQKKIARQDLGGYAMSCALDELYGLGFAHADQDDAKYEAVTLEQVKVVAQKFLTPDRLVIAVIGPE